MAGRNNPGFGAAHPSISKGNIGRCYLHLGRRIHPVPNRPGRTERNSSILHETRRWAHNYSVLLRADMYDMKKEKRRSRPLPSYTTRQPPAHIPRSHLCYLTVSSGPLGMDCTTSLISGIRCTNRLSRPIFIVIVLEGQLPQAPSNSSRTTGPSISTTRTFPLEKKAPGERGRGGDVIGCYRHTKRLTWFRYMR